MDLKKGEYSFSPNPRVKKLETKNPKGLCHMKLCSDPEMVVEFINRHGLTLDCVTIIPSANYIYLLYQSPVKLD